MSTRDDELRKILRRWRDAEFIIDPEDPERCIDNPRLGEASIALRGEIEELLEREPGRPTDVAGEWRNRLRRASCAELLYLGKLPSEDVPKGCETDARSAAGNRAKADKLAARITNSSVRRVQDARKASVVTLEDEHGRKRGTAWELASEPGLQVRERSDAELVELWKSIRR